MFSLVAQNSGPGVSELFRDVSDTVRDVSDTARDVSDTVRDFSDSGKFWWGLV